MQLVSAAIHVRGVCGGLVNAVTCYSTQGRLRPWLTGLLACAVAMRWRLASTQNGRTNEFSIPSPCSLKGSPGFLCN